MSTNWKPGDVAMVAGEVVIRVAYSGGVTDHAFVDGLGRHWRHEDDTARPLVVIDPEDREQVERLRDDLINSGWIPDGEADALDNILRHFANPTTPKPDEPTGLGAVVEDAEGCKWMRAGTDPGDCWRRAGIRCSTDGIAGWTQYADIAAVRVLSEGVQA